MPVAPLGPSSNATEVHVDWSANRGPTGQLFRTGSVLSISYPTSAAVLGSYTSEQLPGAFEIQVLQGFDQPTLVDFVNLLPSRAETTWIKAISSGGGIPVVKIEWTPPWLQISPGNTLAPPTDLDGWSTYVQAIVDFYSTGHLVAGTSVRGISLPQVLYSLWDEPDNAGIFAGNQNQYFALYQATVKGGFASTSAFQIGGPSVSNVSATKPSTPSGHTMLQDFLSYCATTPLPAYNLSRLPVDFIDWHEFFTNRSGQPVFTERGVRKATGWATDAGYHRSTYQLRIGAWHSWVDFHSTGLGVGEDSAERDTEFGAAFIGWEIWDMIRRGVDQASLWRLVNYGASPPPTETFSGDFGLFTTGPSATICEKATYNAFRLLNKMEGTRCDATAPHPYLFPLASRNGRQLNLLLTYFHFSGERDAKMKFRLFTQRGWNVPQLLSWGFTQQSLEDVLGGVLDLSDFADEVAPSVTSTIVPLAAQDLYEIAHDRALDGAFANRNSSLDVTLKVDDFPSLGSLSGWRMERWIVDRTRSNAATTYFTSRAAGKTVDQATSDAFDVMGLVKTEDTLINSLNTVPVLTVEPLSLNLLRLTGIA